MADAERISSVLPPGVGRSEPLHHWGGRNPQPLPDRRIVRKSAGARSNWVQWSSSSVQFLDFQLDTFLSFVFLRLGWEFQQLMWFAAEVNPLDQGVHHQYFGRPNWNRIFKGCKAKLEGQTWTDYNRCCCTWHFWLVSCFRMVFLDQMPVWQGRFPRRYVDLVKVCWWFLSVFAGQSIFVSLGHMRSQLMATKKRTYDAPSVAPGSARGRSHWCLPLRLAHHWPGVGPTKPGTRWMGQVTNDQ